MKLSFTKTFTRFQGHFILSSLSMVLIVLVRISLFNLPDPHLYIRMILQQRLQSFGIRVAVVIGI